MRIYFSEIIYRFFFILINITTILIVSFVNKEILLFIAIRFAVTDKLFEIDYFIITNVTDVIYSYFLLINRLTTQMAYYYSMCQFLSFLKKALTITEYKMGNYLILLSFLNLMIFSFFFLSAYPIFFYFLFELHNSDCNIVVDLYFEPKILNYVQLLVIYFSDFFWFSQFVIIFMFFFLFNAPNVNTLIHLKKPIYFSTIFLCTFLTPPDIFSQVLVFLSLLLFFEFCVFLICLKRVSQVKY